MGETPKQLRARADAMEAEAEAEVAERKEHNKNVRDDLWQTPLVIAFGTIVLCVVVRVINWLL